MGDEAEDINCVTNPLGSAISFNYFLAPISACCMCFVVWIFVKFIGTWKRSPGKNPKAGKMLFGTGSGFLANIVLFFLTNVVTYALHCNDRYFDVYGVFYVVNLLFFVLDFATIMLLFYQRLYYVFVNSAYAVSRRTNRIFWSSYVATICFGFLGVSMIFAIGLQSPVVLVLAALFLISYLCVLVGLIGLFLRKLYTVYQQAARLGNQADPHLKTIITRTSMLATMSLSLSIITFIAILISIPLADSLGFNVFTHSMITIDKFTNALCIAYTYDGFTDVYMRWCSLCHGTWADCWVRCTADNSAAGQLQQTVRGSDVGVQKSVASTTDGDTEMTVTHTDLPSKTA